jgi:hypothetical protein
MEDVLKKLREKAEERRRNYKGLYCCLTMDARLSKEATSFYYDHNIVNME